MFRGKYHQNGGFSMAMLVSGRVPFWKHVMKNPQWLFHRHLSLKGSRRQGGEFLRHTNRLNIKTWPGQWPNAAGNQSLIGY